MKIKLRNQLLAIPFIALLAGLVHGVIAWLLADIERLNITVPTFLDSFCYFALFYLLVYIVGYITMFVIKTDKLIFIRYIALYVVMAAVVDQILVNIELNWIVALLYGIVTGIKGVKFWLKNHLRYNSGLDETMINILVKN